MFFISSCCEVWGNGVGMGVSAGQRPARSEHSSAWPADALLGFAARAMLQEEGYLHQRHKPGSYSDHGSLAPSQHQTQVGPAPPRLRGAEGITVPALH